jgi:hypothetical protein
MAARLQLKGGIAFRNGLPDKTAQGILEFALVQHYLTWFAPPVERGLLLEQEMDQSLEKASRSSMRKSDMETYRRAQEIISRRCSGDSIYHYRSYILREMGQEG